MQAVCRRRTRGLPSRRPGCSVRFCPARPQSLHLLISCSVSDRLYGAKGLMRILQTVRFKLSPSVSCADSSLVRGSRGFLAHIRLVQTKSGSRGVGRIYGPHNPSLPRQREPGIVPTFWLVQTQSGSRGVGRIYGPHNPSHPRQRAPGVVQSR